MFRKSAKEVQPRDGRKVCTMIIARISGCKNQKEASLDDQLDNCKDEFGFVYSGPVDFTIFKTVGKGESLDRPELARIEAAYLSGKFDFALIEDLGRLVRGCDAVRLLGLGVDHGTHTIVINDCIDTAEVTWEEDALVACSEHVGHNAHTSRRLKHKMMNRFVRYGACTRVPIYSYIKPPGCKTYNDWTVDPIAHEWVMKGFKLLRETKNFSAVADFFNENEVPTGPACTSKLWSRAMVRLAAQGEEQRAIARMLQQKPTQTAVWDALQLEKLRIKKGLTTPYVFVAEPPTDYPKLRRHKHRLFKFKMQEGYTPPEI